MMVYVKLLNYLVFFGNRMFQAIAYLVLIVLFVVNGSHANAAIMVAAFLVFALSLDVLFCGLLLMPMHAKLFSLPTSDQALRNVGWYYAARFGEDPRTWEM